METPSTVATTTTRKFSFRSRRTKELQQQQPCENNNGSAATASRLRRGTALLRRLPRRTLPRTIHTTPQQEQPSSPMSTTTTTTTPVLTENNDTTNPPPPSCTAEPFLDPAPVVQKPPLPPTVVTTVVVVVPQQQQQRLPAALVTWNSSAHAVLQSAVWHHFLHASHTVVQEIGHTIVVDICGWPLRKSRDMVLFWIETVLQPKMLLLDARTSRRQPPSSSTTIQQHGGLPGLLLGVTSHIVGSIVLPLLGLGNDKSSSQKDTDDDDDYLDKLRLDYVPTTVRRPTPMDGSMEPKHDDDDSSMDRTTESSSSGSSSSSSLQPLPHHMLLRIDDLVGLEDILQDGDVSTVDLHPEYCRRHNDDDDDHLPHRQVLAALVATTLQLFSTNASCALQLPVVVATSGGGDTTIRWHPEGATKKLEGQLRIAAAQQTNDILRHETLVWSGKWTDPSPPRRPHTLYMARGILPLSPLALLRLLWDNDRVHTYNPYCVERTTIASLSPRDADAAVLHGTLLDNATKVIRTVLRVAGLTVTAHNLMHVIPLDDTTTVPPAASYLLVGRTLESHQRNEIVWGCNWLRPVPGDAKSTELTSLSQVASSVPQFVAHRMGLNGIADFFRQVREMPSVE